MMITIVRIFYGGHNIETIVKNGKVSQIYSSKKRKVGNKK